MSEELIARAEEAATAAPPLVDAPPWAGGAVDAALAWARSAGVASVLVIAPFELPADARSMVGAALRDDEEAAATDIASELVEALGSGLRSDTVVVYAGCFATSRDTPALAREISGVQAVARAVVVIEEDPPPSRCGADPRAALEAAGLDVFTDARLRGRDGAGGIWRLRRLALAPDLAQSRNHAPLQGVRVCTSDHQGKSLGLVEGLARGGAEIVWFADEADIVLIDHDVPFHGKLGLVEACVANGGRAFLYPHCGGATLMAEWDGIHEPSPLLSGALMPAPGHVEIARRYGYPHPVRSIGWSICPMRPRTARGRVERVLYAPSHPPHFGNPRWADWARRLLGELSELPVELTVRYIGTMEENGLWEAPGVRFVCGQVGDAPSMLDQIDAADVVVGDYGTFSSMAVARGVATVIFDSDVHQSNDGTSEPAHIDLYRDYIRYPFDVRDGDLMDVMRAAAEDERQVAEWRARFVGEPLQVATLARALGYG